MKKEISQVNDTLEKDKKKSQEKSMGVRFTQSGPHIKQYYLDIHKICMTKRVQMRLLKGKGC